MFFIRTIFIFLALATVVVAPAHSSPAKVEKYVGGLVQDTIDVIESPRTDEQKLELLASSFRNTMDIPWVGRFVLGKHWRAASDAQKQAYIKYYDGFLTNIYSARFTEYTGQQVDITDTKSIGSGEYQTKVTLSSENIAPLAIQYKLRTNGSSFKVFDIIVEEVSLITTQRAEFSSIVERKGLNRLIQLLKKKAEQPVVIKR